MSVTTMYVTLLKAEELKDKEDAAKHKIPYSAWMKQVKKTAAAACTVSRFWHSLFKFSGNCSALK